MGDIQVGASTRYKCRYHYVWGTKYRHQLLTDPVAHHLKKIILGICERYGYLYDSLGTDGDHVHLLVGGHPAMTPESIIRTVKSISAKALFHQFPSVKNIQWGGSIWAIGYYWSTVGDGPTELVIRQYVQKQGTKEEKLLFKQMKLL